MNIDTDYPEDGERRNDPERLLDDTRSNLNFAIVRRRAFGRGYWLGYASAATCALIWVVIDLYGTGRLGSWGL